MNDLTCTELREITQLSDIENCFLYDKPENHKTKQKYCIEEYNEFCKSLNYYCEEQLTDECKEAKFFETRDGYDPNQVHFKEDILANYCNKDNSQEYMVPSDYRCSDLLLTCQDFENINFNIDEYYKECE